MASALDQALLDARMPPGQLITRAMVRDALDEHFKVVGDVLRMAALAAALLGAIVLAAGTGFNVLERTREIGVLRALGATARGIAGMLLAEGAAIAFVAARWRSPSRSRSRWRSMARLRARSSMWRSRCASRSRASRSSAAARSSWSSRWVALDLALRRSVRETLNYEG